MIGNAKLYNADCLSLLQEIPANAAIVSDPPYGMGYDTDSTRFSGGEERPSMPPRGQGRSDRSIPGDDKPFDPTPWLTFKRVTLWGANHYAQKLPVGTTLVWLKRAAHHYGAFLSDAEIGWQSWGHGVYCFHAPDSIGRRRKEVHGTPFGPATAHPSQKPLALMHWCLDRTGVAPIYADPYMGSGTTGIACAERGLPFIGCELDPDYFDLACERIENAQRQSRMFA